MTTKQTVAAALLGLVALSGCIGNRILMGDRVSVEETPSATVVVAGEGETPPCCCKPPIEPSPEHPIEPPPTHPIEPPPFHPIEPPPVHPIEPTPEHPIEHPPVEEDPVTAFGEFTTPREVTNTTGGVNWHFLNGEVRDNFGDGFIAEVTTADGEQEYWGMCRMGTPPPGGVFFRKPADGNPYSGWEVNVTATPKSLPQIQDSPSWRNIDTHVFAQNPLSGVVTFLHGTKTGWLWPAPDGDVNTFSVQRATALRPTSQGGGFTRFPTDYAVEPNVAPWETTWQRGMSYFGGPGESSILISPPYALMFYEHKTYGPADAFGQTFKGRIGRAQVLLEDLDAGVVQFERTPSPSSTSWVFDPVDTPDYGDNNDTAVWGSANVTLQSNVTRAADGVLHMVWIGAKPNTGKGKVNKSTGLGHAWSLDDGYTWVRDPSNPFLLSTGLPGYIDVGQANRINSPFLLHVDGKIFWMFWGNPTGEQNKLGTRLWCMEMAL